MKVRNVSRLWYTDRQRHDLIANEDRLVVLNRRAALVLARLRIVEGGYTDVANSLRHLSNQITRFVRSCERILGAASKQGPKMIIVTIGLLNAPPDAEDGGGTDSGQVRDVPEDQRAWPEQEHLCAKLSLQVGRLADHLQAADERIGRRAAVQRKIPYCIFAAMDALARALDHQKEYLLRWATTTRPPKIVVECDCGGISDCRQCDFRENGCARRTTADSGTST